MLELTKVLIEDREYYGARLRKNFWHGGVQEFFRQVYEKTKQEKPKQELAIEEVILFGDKAGQKREVENNTKIIAKGILKKKAGYVIKDKDGNGIFIMKVGNKMYARLNYKYEKDIMKYLDNPEENASTIDYVKESMWIAVMLFIQADFKKIDLAIKETEKQEVEK